MKAELTELSEVDSKTNYLAVTEEANIDEAVPIYLEKNETHKHIIYTMDIDIDKVNTFEKRNKVSKIKWRPRLSHIFKNFSDDFMQQCKDNANVAQFIPLDMKNNINQMALEQG